MEHNKLLIQKLGSKLKSMRVRILAISFDTDSDKLIDHINDKGYGNITHYQVIPEFGSKI